ncbi:reverse transcriptase family protein [Algibacter sp. R77976]|uniref:reverse transcriptase family protein n=1 Tax=Algibacter sp. R77976 TaxID=3093873 RepID=UPI0037C8C58E
MENKNYIDRFKKKALQRNLEENEIEACLNYQLILNSNGCPVVYDDLHLSKLVGYRINFLRRACYYQKSFYRHYEIPKKAGGTRLISEPLPSLKEIQRWIIDVILANVPVSKFAKAYKKNGSVFKHAFLHKSQEVVFALDIKDFFRNINEKMIFKMFSNFGYTNHLSGILCKLCSLENELAQGAPTSPIISNILLREFDNLIGNKVISMGGRYSRYADDLTFSGNFDFPFEEIVIEVENMLNDLGFSLNEAKTKKMPNYRRQMVTGVIVNEKVQISKKDRREIRQACHYIKNFGLKNHLEKIGETRRNYTNHLMGRINFGLQMNPHDEELKSYMSLLKDLI